MILKVTLTDIANELKTILAMVLRAFDDHRSTVACSPNFQMPEKQIGIGAALRI